MTDYPGMGVLIQMLGGNRDTVEAVQASIGREIASIGIKDNTLRIAFVGGATLSLRDGGQSCCEARWMEAQTDNLDQFVGGVLQSVEVRDVNPAGVAQEPLQESDYGFDVLESQFLWVTTSKGVAVFANYNDHNGYYGGFWIEGEATTAPAPNQFGGPL
jgi:hypothetical protein